MSSFECNGGTVQELGGLKSYITGPPHSKLAILLISDVLGYETPKLRKLADKVGAAGFLVLVPDLLFGDYYELNNPNFDQQSWIKAHGIEKASQDTEPLIAALKSKGVTAIGVAGFCWGGAVAAKLASSIDIYAVVLLHPALITNDIINEVKVPIAILGAEIDNSSSPEQLKQFGEMLSLKAEKFESFVKIYDGVATGWTVWYKDEDESSVKRAEEAHQEMLKWFKKHIK
ncbi:endo-1,3-1,4-beta-D-glucanase-like [Senna tora]|uniref:Endo-1,3-1,4-beta-D-glucanase-like n=1 Tax=Senna tora TaxID=362788 RepID=A0A834X438_9FABA|nr:endo-1,3-1,4-beta-D-glucanase-like [Senna tora]